MSPNVLSAGMAVLVWATPIAAAVAQERGTIEFGGFASAATFDNTLSLKTGRGGGGRIGAYVYPRLSIEFEDAEMRATRPDGLRDVNVGILSTRLVAVPIRWGSLSLLLGAGAGVGTETNFLHSYGVDALAGAKLALGSNVALRVDGMMDWLANAEWKTYTSVHVGLSVYRRPLAIGTTRSPGAGVDSVSASEMHRLRARDAALRALRDSLARPPRPTPA